VAELGKSEKIIISQKVDLCLEEALVMRRKEQDQ
jgi:hypothetical protein